MLIAALVFVGILWFLGFIVSFRLLADDGMTGPVFNLALSIAWPFILVFAAILVLMPTVKYWRR